MSRSTIIASSLACVLLTTSLASSQAPAGGDLEKLQGKWTAVTLTPGGGKIRVVMEFNGDMVYSTTGEDASAKPQSEQKVTLDESASPKRMNFAKGKNPSAEPGSFAEKVGAPAMKMGYELDGDSLTLCVNLLSDKLPAKIAPAKGLMISKYKRGEWSIDQMAAMTAPTTKAKIPTPKIALVGDLATLQGTWQNKSGHINASEKETLSIIGDVLIATAKLRRGEAKYASQIKLDESSTPKAIDFLNPSVGPPEGKRKNLEVAYGIYELDGDTLKIHKSGQGKGRASVFRNGAEQGSVSVWVRENAGRAANQPASKKQQRSATAPTPPAQPSGKLKRAVVGKTTREFIGKTKNEYISLTIDGAEVRIYKDEPHAATFDIAGKRLPNQDAAKMLREGNIIEVDFFAKHPAHPYYLLSEIHLIQGEMK